MPDPTCTLPDCDKRSRNRSPGLCDMHYSRQRYHGDTSKTSWGITTAPDRRRYRSCSRPGHPLASRNGSVLEHRAVLYDAIGPGPHPCHHCGTPVDWHTSDRSAQLEVDHLNHTADDNRRENLVPSCRSCNRRRSGVRRHRALVDAGWWSGHDTERRNP
jgi:hypothetical protein